MLNSARRLLLLLAPLWCPLLGLAAASAQTVNDRSFPDGPNPHAVATFHSIGLYWYRPGLSASSTAQVSFKVQGSAEDAKRGLDLWYDSRNGEFRGSLVHLRPGTKYDITITHATTSVALTGVNAPTTWSETDTLNVPEDHKIVIPAGTTRIVLVPSSEATPRRDSTPGVGGDTVTVHVPRGDDDGPKVYTRITADPGNPIGYDPVPNTPAPTGAAGECIYINLGVRRVLITGLKVQGCKQYGINFQTGTSGLPIEDIVIDKNEFVGWGGIGRKTAGIPDTEGALSCRTGSDHTVKPVRIVVQRNVFSDPRYSATPWGPGGGVHPEGPLAVYFRSCGTNHVFRYNEIYAGTSGHHFNDGLGGEGNDANFSTEGFPGADSDVYGNSIKDVFDDAIEAEGGNRHARIWGNYMDRTFVAIGNVVNYIGPLYVWRNISDHMALMRDPNGNSDTEDRGPFVKGGNKLDSNKSGRAYYFHNTVLQPPPPPGRNILSGADRGLQNVDGRLFNFESKNNIWHNDRTDRPSINADCNLGYCESNFDLYNANIVNAGPTTRPNGESWRGPGTPVYDSSGTIYPDLGDEPGNFSLASNSPGRGEATPIFNFNDQYAAPDVGAHQSGEPPMEFGVAAAPAAAPPQAQMMTTPTSGSAPLTVSFDATASTPGSAPISSYTINFGDGTPNGSGAQQSHGYATAGTFVATLTVTDANGASDTFTQTIQVSEAGGGGGGGSTPFEMGLSANPGLAVNRGEGIAFAASASDGRALQSVRFLFDGVLKLTDTTAPYEYPWTSSASDTIGNHTLTVEVTDIAGTAMSETRTITILPAACGIFVNAASLTQGQTLTVQSICSAWENPERLDVIVDDIIIRRDPVRPYAWLLDTGTLALGPHTVRVRGVLGAGRESNASANVTVAAAPLAISIAPGPTVMRGEPVTITASASDGRTLREVHFFVDGHFRAGELVAPFRYTWTGDDGYGRRDAFGRHTLFVQATDTNGEVLTATRELYALAQPCNALAETSRFQVGGNDTVGTGAIAVTQGENLSAHALCSAARTVEQVVFRVDGATVTADAIAPYGTTVGTSGLAAGSHTLSIHALFPDGAESTHALTFEVVAP